MQKFFAAAASSVAVLVVFAGAAHSSATIDLIWVTSDTDEIVVSDPGALIQLKVMLTAGPNGSEGAAVGVDFSSVGGKSVLFGVMNTPSTGFDSPLPLELGLPEPGESGVDMISAICICASGVGVGLAAGESQQLGVITFYVSQLVDGTYEFLSDAADPREGVLDGDGNEIPKAEITFNSAQLVLSRTTYVGGPKRRQKSR